MDPLRYLLGACYAVPRRNCIITTRFPGGYIATWHQSAELVCSILSAEAGKNLFRYSTKTGAWKRLLEHSLNVDHFDVLHIDIVPTKCRRTATGARNSLITKVHHGPDDLGFVRRLLTSPGQQGDCACAEALTSDHNPFSENHPKTHKSGQARFRLLVKL